MLMMCSCKHEYQQEKYGSLRVHTVTKQHKNVVERKARCTVCLLEKDIPQR